MTRSRTLARLRLAAAALALLPAVARADDRSIVPGKSIGQVCLNSPVDALKLGPASFGDGAAGTVWSTWNAKKPDAATGILHTVDVLGHVGERGHDVAVVRVTSPWFRTTGGLSTGSTLAEVRRNFPQVRRVNQYTPRQVPITVAVFDDSAHGITFEILCDAKGSATAASRCLAIAVHRAGKPIRDEPLVPYLENKAATEAANSQGKR